MSFLYGDPNRQVHAATFTMSLKDVLDYAGATVVIDNNRAKVSGGDDIGLYSYPLFDPSYRDSLNGLIVDHFWNREIGQESPSMFGLSLRRKMNEIMPYYNQRYLSTRITFDPLSTMDVHTVVSGTSAVTGTEHATNSNTSNGSSKSRSVVSETPQTMLSGDEDYASNANDVNGTSENTGSGTADSNSTNNVDTSGDTHTTGYQGLASDLLIRYRQSLVNIDLEVIAELESLFMGVWDTGDTYAPDSVVSIYGYGPFGYYPYY